MMVENVEQVASANSMLDAFSTMQRSTELTQAIKEFFDPEKLYMITELTKDEIRLITRMMVLSEIKHIDAYGDGIKLFMMLMISHERKSRREIINAIGGFRRDDSFLGKINPFKRGD